ncbi:trimeric intracellular cation channel family protein, partial [Vibrio cholerae]
ELYASIALLASGLYLVLLEFGVSDVVSTVVTLVVGYT